MSNWVPYQHGMAVVGRRVKVMGTAQSHNEAINVYSGKFCRIPGGLTGVVNSLVGLRFKVTFSSTGDYENRSLWPRIAGIGPENRDTLVCTVDPSRMIGFFLEVP